MTDPTAGAIIRHPRWPWVVLGLGLAWTVLIRVPLILNAEDHLDSDLAVDGLTLIDAVNGHWRWHYPGTPHMGILPMLFSYPQALVWGANAVTLVSGGTLIWLLIVTGTFWLAWKVYGPSVAGWAILPLVFSSNGTIWLSGRITGGHLLTLVWHILAFVGLHACLTSGGRLRAAALGIWCGLGLYLDLMFLFTLFGLAPAALLAWILGGRWRLKIGTVSAFFLAMIVGFLPHEIGRLIDPFDAYPSQFQATFDRTAMLEHRRLLGLYCLPRLIAGTELNEFDHLAVRDDWFLGQLMVELPRGRLPALPPGKELLAVVFLAGLVVAVIRLVIDAIWRDGFAGKAIGLGVFLSAFLIVAAFVVNRNIYNSDNYRYLVYLLPAWSLGFGLVIGDLTRAGMPMRVAACIIVITLIWGTTASSLRWYQETLGYLGERARPVLVRRPAWSELRLNWSGPRGARTERKYNVPLEVSHIFGGYWDVYRMAFLSGGRVVGIPYPMFPNRFRGWSRGLGADQGELLVLGLRNERIMRMPVRRLTGSSTTAPELGERYKRLDMTAASNWRSPFETVWQDDGRDPAEINRIRVILPSVDVVGP